MGLDRRSDRPAAGRGAFEITDESGDETSFDATGTFPSLGSEQQRAGQGRRAVRLRTLAVAALLPLAIGAVWAIVHSHEASGPTTPPSSSRQLSTRTERTRARRSRGLARGHVRLGRRSPSRRAALAALRRARHGRVVRRRPSRLRSPRRAAGVTGPSPRPTPHLAPGPRPAVAPAPASPAPRPGPSFPSPAASEFGFEG